MSSPWLTSSCRPHLGHLCNISVFECFFLTAYPFAGYSRVQRDRACVLGAGVWGGLKACQVSSFPWGQPTPGPRPRPGPGQGWLHQATHRQHQGTQYLTKQSIWINVHGMCTYVYILGMCLHIKHNGTWTRDQLFEIILAWHITVKTSAQT